MTKENSEKRSSARESMGLTVEEYHNLQASLAAAFEQIIHDPEVQKKSEEFVRKVTLATNNPKRFRRFRPFEI